MSDSNTKSGGLTGGGLLYVALIVLKIIGYISASWWLVILWPLLIMLIILGIVLLWSICTN